MIQAILLVVVSESCTMVGQILYKKGTNQLEPPSLKNQGSYLRFFWAILQLPGIWLGLFCMGVGLVVWLIALSKFDLSLVFPVSSMQYILALIGSRIFLREKIDRMKLLGTLLITGGIIAISFSA